MFLLTLFYQYNMLLILSAVIPAVYLMIKVYQLDRIEKEPINLLIKLFFLGILSTLLAMVAELIGGAVLGFALPDSSTIYIFIDNFIIVALAEEGFKYMLVRKATWNHPAFDYRFDGIIYCVFLGAGFAIWENLGYVYSYGLGTAFIRAVTAVPGHVCFGVFMGLWYGQAKFYESRGMLEESRRDSVLALLIPVLLHGTYDFLATISSSVFSLIFTAFIIAMFVIACKKVKQASDADARI